LSATAIDVLALMAGNQTGILSSHLAVAGSGGQPVYPWLNGPAGLLAEMKNAAGWPADIYQWDANWIYNTATEVDDNATDYNNPKTYRQMASSSTASGGYIWMPRFYTQGSPEVLIQTPDSSYVEYLNGVAQPKQNLGGPVITGFSGPWNDTDFGGDIGQQPYYLQRYLYNPAFASQEQNCYIPNLGRVRWQMFNAIKGIYTLAQTALFNTRVSGPCPKLSWVPA
jgi:hypothetical protein